METKSSGRTCSICGKTYRDHDVVPTGVIREPVAEEIRRDRPEWKPDGYVCRQDLNTYRTRYFHKLLEKERGELSHLEQEVMKSLDDQRFLSAHMDGAAHEARTLGQRMADRIATFGGSWAFLLSFAAFLLLWIVMNTVVLVQRPPDPYPFILLNLLLSCLAAVQAPIIMMSQNRQEAKDRRRSQHDYQVNLKAELEIRGLHEKLDHILSHQWERLAEMQAIQLEVLAEISKKK